MKQLPTAAEAAILLAVCVKRKETEAGKEFTRLRLSEKAFGRLTGRKRLDSRFIADLNESLLDHNLLTILTGEAIGVMKASGVKGWPRVTSDRMNAELRKLRDGTLNFDKLAEELEEDQSGFDEEEDGEDE
jgi:hypothetical protein